MSSQPSVDGLDLNEGGVDDWAEYAARISLELADARQAHWSARIHGAIDAERREQAESLLCALAFDHGREVFACSGESSFEAEMCRANCVGSNFDHRCVFCDAARSA